MITNSTNKLVEITNRNLKTWSLWVFHENTHKILSKNLDKNKIWLGCHKINQSYSLSAWDNTHFDVNIIDDIFYLLGISISKEYRGKGHGNDLYVVLENIAREFGCSKIQMNPSGETQTGDSRKNYLLKRGYNETGIEVYKDLQKDR